MVQAIINIEEDTNRILNMVKAKYALKDKSEAINMVAKQYADLILEPELRPEYIQKAQEIQKQKTIKVGNINSLKRKLKR